MKLTDRGYVEPGFFADLVVFNPDQIVDVATFDEPHKFAAGIVHVVVNGKMAIRDGVQTEALAGSVLRR
jgi:N-acyl-D-aspartate/D-glutamate deacylase